MGDEEKPPDNETPTAGTVGISSDEECTKDSAPVEVGKSTVRTPDNYEPLSDHSRRILRCWEYDADSPWTREEVVNIIGGDLAKLGYTDASIDATTSDALINVWNQHKAMERITADTPLSDRIAAHKDLDELREATPTLKLRVSFADVDAPARPRGSVAAEMADRSRDGTTILITTDQKDVVDQAERALVAKGGVYVRGRKLVHVVRDVEASDWYVRPDGQPVIVEMKRSTVQEELGQAAEWLAVDGKKKKVKPAMVPTWAVETLMSRDRWMFPPIEGIADAPTMRRDGSILDVPGYDQATRLIYDPGNVRFSPLPNAPTRDDAKAALAALLDPFVDFPFVAECDRTATAAAILSIVGRPAIEGCVPMFGSVAPTPGSGKGLLVDLVAIIATGRVAPKMPPSKSSEEDRKRILPIVVEAPSVITIDNVEASLGSAALAMLLTTGEYTDRELGASRIVRVPVRSVWTYTGCNVRLKGDLGRRVIPIRLDPKVEHPEDRDGWRHSNVMAHVRAQRPELVVHALTVLRAYDLAGRPSHGKPAKGSFESWDALVRGAIIWAGGEDPTLGVQSIREAGDEDLDALRTLVTTWREVYPDRAVTAREVMGDVRMREALVHYQVADAAGLGRVLSQIEGRIVDGYAIRSTGRSKAGRLWQVGA